MNVSRRRFLGLSLDAGLLAGPGLRLVHAGDAEPPWAATFRAFLDTLIPADQTPSATQAGVTEKLVAKAAAIASYRQLVERGCAWLDRRARDRGADGFAALVEADREAVVRGLTEGAGDLRVRIFFDEVRDDAFFHYYARPEAWRGLPYAGPPQPGGYLDFADPPRRSDG